MNSLRSASQSHILPMPPARWANRGLGQGPGLTNPNQVAGSSFLAGLGALLRKSQALLCPPTSAMPLPAYTLGFQGDVLLTSRN